MLDILWAGLIGLAGVLIGTVVTAAATWRVQWRIASRADKRQTYVEFLRYMNSLSYTMTDLARRYEGDEAETREKISAEIAQRHVVMALDATAEMNAILIKENLIRALITEAIRLRDAGEPDMLTNFHSAHRRLALPLIHEVTNLLRAELHPRPFWRRRC